MQAISFINNRLKLHINNNVTIRSDWVETLQQVSEHLLVIPKRIQSLQITGTGGGGGGGNNIVTLESRDGKLECKENVEIDLREEGGGWNSTKCSLKVGNSLIGNIRGSVFMNNVETHHANLKIMEGCFKINRLGINQSSTISCDAKCLNMKAGYVFNNEELTLVSNLGNVVCGAMHGNLKVKHSLNCSIKSHSMGNLFVQSENQMNICHQTQANEDGRGKKKKSTIELKGKHISFYFYDNDKTSSVLLNLKKPAEAKVELVNCTKEEFTNKSKPIELVLSPGFETCTIIKSVSWLETQTRKMQSECCMLI